MGVVHLLRNGSRVVADVEEILARTEMLAAENQTLITFIERQGAALVALGDKVEVVSNKLDKIQDEVTVSRKTTTEIKHTKFYGQATRLLDSALDKVSELSNKEIRSMIHRAAKAHPSGRRKGYTYIYSKLAEVVGFDVYAHGKVILKKSDGIEGWSKDPSYINTIIKHGKQREAAVICMQVLADK